MFFTCFQLISFDTEKRKRNKKTDRIRSLPVFDTFSQQFETKFFPLSRSIRWTETASFFLFRPITIHPKKKNILLRMISDGSSSSYCSSRSISRRAVTNFSGALIAQSYHREIRNAIICRRFVTKRS